MGDAAASGAFLDRLRHQAGAGERRSRWPTTCTPSRRWRRPSRNYEDARRTRGAAAAVGGAQLAGVVRGGRALSRPRSGAVQLFAAHPLAAHQPREPAAARSGVAAAAPKTGSSSRPARQQPAPRADVRAVPPARRRAGEPRRRLADGAVQGGRRLPDRLALRPLRRARQGRRRPGLHRDDLRQPGGPHHARLHRLLRAGARGGLEAARRLRARRDRRQDLLSGRPLRTQGFDPARLGGTRYAAVARATGR